MGFVPVVFNFATWRLGGIKVRIQKEPSRAMTRRRQVWKIRKTDLFACLAREIMTVLTLPGVPIVQAVQVVQTV